jgi:acrylyl-CoA reductase (NADPH)
MKFYLMSQLKFNALEVLENEPNSYIRRIREKSVEELPEGDVLIEVSYSSLNYKDALSSRGHKGITRHYPHTPGIDASGIVFESSDPRFNSGDKVIVTGYDLGMNTSGGFCQFIRVPGDWIVPLPNSLTIRDAMIYGTAGFTAGIALYELQRHEIFPDSGKILVTGASGGVGCLAVGMLSKIGYEVSASTGKSDFHSHLYKLGAKEILSRENVVDTSAKPLLEKRWAGVIENVGGNTLTTALKSLKQYGVLCCIGNVESDRFETTVYPFILRGVTMVGIDSAFRPMDIRKLIWEKISGEWKIDDLSFIVTEVSLNELDTHINLMLEGKGKGRILINLKE